MTGSSERGSITRRAGVSYRALPRHSKSAFTLTELLVVIGIIVLLISLSMPAIINAKRHAKQAKSNQQMRQLQAAILLYADSQSGEGDLGLGLPPSLVALKSVQNLPDELFRTGGSGYKSPAGNALYTWMPPLSITYSDLMPAWRNHIQARQGDPILIIDETFVEHPDDLFGVKSGYGIYWSGSLVRRSTAGSLSDYKVWL